MSVLSSMAEHYRTLRQQTAEQITLIDKGKLVIVRQGRDCTEYWRAYLIDRLAKIDTVRHACEHDKR
jgi:hypothetical protein